MPFHSARFAPLQVAVWTLLAVLATAGPALAAPAGTPSLDRTAADDEAALVVARDRSARADMAVDDLKHALTPGHLADPLPEADRPFGLETLQAQYDDMQRQAAGYRATLGDQHPTLLAAEQIIGDLKGQLLGATRRALATAEREAAEARKAASTIERRLAVLAADAVAVQARAASEQGRAASEQGRAASEQGRAASEQGRATSEQGRGDDIVTGAIAPGAAHPSRDAPTALPADRRPATASTFRTSVLRAAAGVLALLLIAWAALQGDRALRGSPRRSPSRRVEPALARATPVAAPGAPVPEGTPGTASPARLDAVPVLATLFQPGPGRLDEMADAFGREPRGTIAAAAAGLHATLCDALDGAAQARMTVLVTGIEASADRVSAALALALAAAAAGRRVALMEARAPGSLRDAVLPGGGVPMLIAAGGTQRTVYGLGAGPLTVAILPSDAGEAEAAAAASLRAGTARLSGLDVFDTVILLGDATGDLVRAADLVLIAVPAGAAPATVAAVAAPCREAGRLCGAVVVGPTVPVAARRPAPARRRPTADPHQAAAGRLGLRGSFGPERRRVG